MNVRISNSLEVVPFSLKEAPSFVENQFPVGRISAEVYKERKAIHGQALTGLGSYWKGRKPLLLVRACILGILLPATKNPLTDLRLFLALLGMDDRSFLKRIKSVKPSQIDRDWSGYDELVDDQGKPRWKESLSKQARLAKVSQWLMSLPYAKRLAYCYRPDECPEDLHEGIWPEVNAHFGTHATSLPQFIDQLGIMRYGHRPNVADTFAGGGSIPFEAARIGCHAAASDLNPVACMLTWGALNVIGGTQERRSAISAAQRRLGRVIA